MNRFQNVNKSSAGTFNTHPISLGGRVGPYVVSAAGSGANSLVIVPSLSAVHDGTGRQLAIEMPDGLILLLQLPRLKLVLKREKG